MSAGLLKRTLIAVFAAAEAASPGFAATRPINSTPSVPIRLDDRVTLAQHVGQPRFLGPPVKVNRRPVIRRGGPPRSVVAPRPRVVAPGHRVVAPGQQFAPPGQVVTPVRPSVTRGHRFLRPGHAHGVRPWRRRPYYGLLIGGVVLGTIFSTTAPGYAPLAPSPDICWWWLDDRETEGYWDYCE